MSDNNKINVGNYEDKDISLHYLARKLVSMFLLSEEKGELIKDMKVRVSVKTLVVTCLQEMIIMCPQIWTLTLDSSNTDLTHPDTCRDIRPRPLSRP